jgi:hypothetical protein
MAKSLDNIFLHGASGTIAALLTLTKKPSGKIVMGKKRGSSSVPPTAVQLEIQRKFRRGVVYAQAAMEDPIKKAAYAAVAGPDQSAYNMALKDYTKAPVVESINTSAYQGAVGDTVSVQAFDDFKVVNVKVSIRSAAGAVLEQGDAVLQPNGLDWLYTATTANPTLAGTIITATAVDTPGNETPKEAVL